MKQVLDETMRASLIGTFVARTADMDMVLDGYLVPAGVSFLNFIKQSYIEVLVGR